jgi:hypothetical protein
LTGGIMKFAKIVFIGAGIWGIVVLTPLYFLFDVTGRDYAAPETSDPSSLIPNPRIPHPESRIPHPASRIPESRITNPQSRIAKPQPEPRIPYALWSQHP